MTANPLATPADMLRLALDTTVMLAEAQVVIVLRTLGMAGVLPRRDGEEQRMVSEKLAAMAEAQAAVFGATLGGASPVAVAEAALKPLSRRTRANVARLSRADGY